MDLGGKIAVIDDSILEKGEVGSFSADLICSPLQESGIKIKHPVGPSSLRGSMAVMGLTRVNEVDNAWTGCQFFSTIGKFQDTFLNDSKGKSIMAVFGKILCDIGCVHQG